MRTVTKSEVSSRVFRASVARSVTRIGAGSKSVKIGAVAKSSNSKINTFMDTSRFRWHKTPTPATDGAQLVFTLPSSEEYVSGLLEVYLDGLLQTKDVDYTETTSSTFTMTAAPDANEALRINYIKQG